jgi:glycosyltransferase involved in cell wall biosynthesis
MGSFDVALIVLTRSLEEANAVQELAGSCAFVDIIHSPRRHTRRVKDLVRSLTDGTPYLIQTTREAEMARAVRERIETWRPDVVQAEQIGAAPLLEHALIQGVPAIYSAHNVESHILRGTEERGVSPLQRLQATMMKKAESSLAGKMDAVVAVSEEEASWFRRYTERVHVIANAVDPDDYRFTFPRPAENPVLLFVGHFGYAPNVDAARVVAREVFPRVKEALPNVSCTLAGKAPPRSMRALAGDRVCVQGNFDEGASIWRSASVFVCPLRWGAGSRIKLLEAAAYGVPIVATPVSAAGLALQPGQDYIQAVTPADISKSVVRLLRDPTRIKSLAQNARKTVERFHNWQTLRPRMVGLYEGIVNHHRKERSRIG